jgi:hypothetical protein
MKATSGGLQRKREAGIYSPSRCWGTICFHPLNARLLFLDGTSSRSLLGFQENL